MSNTKFYQQSWFWLFVAVVIFLINQLPFITDIRPVMYDEAWYGSTAYSCAIGNGFRNTVVGTGGNSNFILPLLESGMMHIVGFNLLAIRLTAVLCGILTLVFLNLSFRQMKVRVYSQILVYAFFVSLTLYNTIFRFGRPECAAIMFMVGGVWMYLRYQENPSWINMTGLSVFVFLAACAHPFSLLFFALLGVYMLIKSIKTKEWKLIIQLLPLLFAALLALVLVTYLSSKYNEANSVVLERFSVSKASMALPIYFKSALTSKDIIYIYPLILLCGWCAFTKFKYKELAIIALIHFAIFPFLFSTDLMMVGLGLDYYVVIATMLLAPCLDSIQNRKWLTPILALYCVMNLGISYYYNYMVKYEKTNTILATDLQSIIPQGAKVFGPLRQWPMVMGTDYQSDHTCYDVLPQEQYDFIILNSQDTPNYAPYKEILPIDESKMELVYSRETKQYGVVEVYKKLNELKSERMKE